MIQRLNGRAALAPAASEPVNAGGKSASIGRRGHMATPIYALTTGWFEGDGPLPPELPTTRLTRSGRGHCFRRSMPPDTAHHPGASPEYAIAPSPVSNEHMHAVNMLPWQQSHRWLSTTPRRNGRVAVWR